MRQEWSTEDLIGSWTLVGNDWQRVGNKTGATRLGFGLLLKFFELEARFPRGPEEFPPAVVSYLAEQLKVDPGEFAAYPWSGRSAKYHREQIRAVYGFREFSVGDEDKLTGWLAAEVCPVELRDEQLREALLVRCRAERIEPTTPGRINRLIGSARATFEKQFCERTVSRLSELSIDRLNNLVAVGAAPLASGRNLLAELKSDPGKVSLETLLREVDKLAAVRALELPADLFADASEKLVDAWRARAARMFPSDLRDMPAPTMLTLLAASCWVRSAEITDALVDLLIELVHKIGTRADRRVEKELTEDLRRVRGKENILFRLAEAAVDHPDDIVREALDFRYNNTAYRPVMAALELLARYASVDGKVRFYDKHALAPLDGVVPKAWREAVVDEKGRVERIPYELCVLVALRDAIRRREIYVDGGNRWRNPEDDLPGDFDTAREVHYAAIRQPLDPIEFINGLKQRMSEALARLDAGLAENTTGGVRLTRRLGEQWISVPKLEKQQEPENLETIKAEVARRWGTLDLLDVLKDADFLTDFTTEFTSVASRESLDRDTPRRRLLLDLFALGTNMGIRAIVNTGEHEESEAALRHVRRHFITRDNLRRATTKLVNATFAARDPHWWGTGTSCASDSKKFGSWESNLMTQYHQRYGGYGVMIYWHVERRNVCIYSQLSERISVGKEDAFVRSLKVNIEPQPIGCLLGDEPVPVRFGNEAEYGIVRVRVLVGKVQAGHDLFDRVIIIGDAAHATSPASGQGASMAIEDAVTLGKCLRDNDHIPSAFATYESLRRKRVERVVAQGKRNGDGKSLGPVMRRLLPLFFRLYKPSEQSMDWMYGHRIDWAQPISADNNG